MSKSQSSLLFQILQKHYSRILTQWPLDLLRPELSFQKLIIQRRRDRIAHLQQGQQGQGQQRQQQESSLSKAKTPSPPAPLSSTVTATTTTTGTKNEPSEKSELEQLNVLYSLLENRYLKKYPLAPSTLTPLSNPTYYNDLLKELDEAPKRSRWQAWLNGWKGFLRFK